MELSDILSITVTVLIFMIVVAIVFEYVGRIMDNRSTVDGTLTINLTGDDPPLQIKLNDISELMGGQKKRIVLTVIDETDYSEWTAGKQELQGP